jgi:plastocyanin
MRNYELRICRDCAIPAASSSVGKVGLVEEVLVRRLLTVLAVAVPLAAFGLALAACGDDDDDDETTAAAETTTEETTTETTTEEAAGGGGGGGGGETVDVSLTDFAIDPADPTVQAGTVTFAVSNDGQAPHNLEVEGDGVEEVLPADLAAGESGDLTVDLQPGTYEWYCPVGNHAAMGMEGELTVE